MANYRAIVHFYCKKGMEDKCIKFLDTELVKKAKTYGAHSIEIWTDELDHSHVIGVAVWNDIEEARGFQSKWEAKEKQLSQYCAKPPHHEFYKTGSAYSEKAKKVA